MCSKKQNAMMFQTTQAQHLVGAQAQQVEQQVAELTAKLNEAEKNGKREVVNYDFWYFNLHSVLLSLTTNFGKWNKKPLSSTNLIMFT